MSSNRYIIICRRNRTDAPPATLDFGELYFTDLNNTLHIGKADGTLVSFGPVDAFSWDDLADKPSTITEAGLSISVSDMPPGYSYNALTNRPDVSALEDVIDVADYASLPTTGETGKLYITLDTGLFYRWTGVGYAQLTGRAAIWGEISGDLTNQADLQNALNAKATTAAVNAAIQAAKEALFPVGSIYTNASDNRNPATLLGFGSWEAFGAGRVMVGHDTNDPDFGAGSTGGEKTHTLTESELPEHAHTASSDSAGSHSHTGSTSTTGAHTHSTSYQGHFLGGSNPYSHTGGGAFAFNTMAQITMSNAGSHSHSVSIGNAGSHEHSISIGNTGAGQGHNNLQPYIAVYMWRRIS